MFYINKITSSSIIDYAAEELKKYLRMMMPEGGDVKIAYDPDAKCGFRLGIMADLGLDASDAEDVSLDDVIYIDTDSEGGIIAGTNPRAVLLAVYEYLRQNGCRWLFPGIDGEFIPMQNIAPIKYRHKASSRIRGNCIEGTPTQKILLDFVEFMPKVGLNTFMIQFRVPAHFYHRRYNHNENTMNFAPESLSDAQIAMWTTELECEIAKRGIALHSYGHGFTTDPFGIDSGIGWATVNEDDYSDEVKANFAMLNGKRGFYFNKPLNTQICMSNRSIRKKVANYVADYMERHSNIDYLHIWLADGSNNHCECEECKKMLPSDWYVMMMNEVDEVLTSRNLDTHIVFIVYVDTFWAPLTEKIKNPERFTVMLAPITRDYAKGYDENADLPPLADYERNKLIFPASLEESIAYFKKWEPAFSGDSFVFEYHFWKPQHYDLSGQAIAKRIYEDIAAYRSLGFDGIIECGSQSSFFPNGFAFYTHARALYDASTSFDDLKHDYYSAAYGKNYEKFELALADLERAMNYGYLSHPAAKNRPEGYATSDAAEKIAGAKAARAALAELVRENYNSDRRIETASVRILEAYDVYLKYMIEIVEKKSLHDDEGAAKCAEEFKAEIGKLEYLIAPYFDHPQAFNAVNNHIVKT